ncbi:CRISPR-associated protein Csn1 [Winogradskyella eckloniae]|uniref:type II CRISPR RNA-guided endonuclease Cas9 n=1 Tax=Winogradskyella eckloniae TaxID=1089306 RepID=UPI001565295A|nr:type II CRISPR RNA-guided endonuclease Cas9 [Winogradskyella eckloniae]NRD21390.1 CRISPR-associated protein Csn1 [Winogradskyella eckloniae]
MKKILGLDLGTNSIGWAQIELDFKNKKGNIKGVGSRIIPMSQDILGKFDAGQSISQTAERTGYRGVRRLYQRDNLRRERLHRVLNVLGMLPSHYKASIDFEKKLGQFKPKTEVKLPYIRKEDDQYSFIFQNSFQEMVEIFKANGYTENIPYDWTIYYLRKKALTQKIEIEELAWLLLNFNQKRGYYQLRGEEEEFNKNKSEEFYALQVADVQATEDTNAKGTWYNVVLENGWIYRRQSKEPLFEWKGKTKEFIITTSLDDHGNVKTDKEGNEKRSFRAVDSEKDWIAIKKKTENDIEDSEKTVGTYIFESLVKNPSQKIRGKLVKTIERKYYRNELEKILDKQLKEYSSIFNDDTLKSCVEELYPRNEAHQNTLMTKDFKHLFVNDIIFYQRPLKSKKSSISDCPYETRSYYKDGELLKRPLKCIPRSNPIYQEFRLWQFIHNLKIYQKEGEENGKPVIDIDVTIQFLDNPESYATLFKQLNSKKEVNQKQLLSLFKLNETSHRWNFPEDKKYPCNETRSQIASRLSKLDGFDVDAFLTQEKFHALWHLIYSVTDKVEYEKALSTFAKKNNLPVANFIENFKRFPPFESSYGAYSEKAIKKLLPLMRMGKYWNEEAISNEVKNRITDIVERLNSIDYQSDKLDTIADDDVPMRLLKSFVKSKNRTHPLQGLNTYQTCYAEYNRHSEIGNIVQWKQPEDIDNYLGTFKQHSLRNPIVEQVVLETLRVVRDVWKYYGEKEIKKGREIYKPLFDEIHVELVREMKNDKKTRERISKANTERENTNERIKALLEELKADPEVIDDVRPYSPSHQEILKIYEDGLFSSLKEVDEGIEKIRKKNKPTKSEIVKYKLWLEQGYISPYTGKIIPLSKLFSTAYQIEHIIPQSRYFDNSMNNKIICESAVNEEKDNKTAYEFIKERGGALIDLGHGKSVSLFTLNDYEQHCQTYFKKNKSKLERLLSEDIPEGFINRQLNDSRYISKIVKGLLSNIVREDGELEATSKHLVPVNGAITSKLKQDWGLNDKWNEIIVPRFKRLNEKTNSNDFGYWDEKINAFRIQVPKELERNFSKKRIDHRHHALDALVIACTTKDHINYITSINTERRNFALVSKLRNTETIINSNGNKRTVAKEYLKPWKDFTTDAKDVLEKTVISFKSNNRVINKTNNKVWKWVNENGQLKKKLVKQNRGQNWAIRKPMHKETVSGKINMEVPKGKIATATRTELTDIKTRKRLESITDMSIQKILDNHLKNYTDDSGNENFELAFNQDGVDELNKNIQKLNGGKRHHPIKKVRLYEVGVKFSIGETGQKSTKFVEAAKGTNLFFNIYWDEKKQKRTFETVPLNEVIAHQKQVAHVPKNERTEVQIDNSKGKFLFSLSPNDLVFVPNKDELNNPSMVVYEKLNREQLERIYKMVSSSGNQCFFIKSEVANLIWNKKEYSALNKMEKDINGNMIKNICWKLKTDRIGNLNGLKL